MASAESGSADSMFSLPSTAHFGQQSPAPDLALLAAGIAAAPAPSVPTEPTDGGPSDAQGVSSGTAALDDQAAGLIAAVATFSPRSSPRTRSVRDNSSSYAPARAPSRTLSSPRCTAAAARGRSGGPAGPYIED